MTKRSGITFWQVALAIALNIAFLMNATPRQATASDVADDSGTVIAITIPRTVHFDTIEGGEVVLGAGLYGVEASPGGRLSLRSADSEPIVIETASDKHGEALQRPAAFAMTGDEVLRLVYLRPDGTSLESVGFIDGIRPRVDYRRTMSRKALRRQARRAQRSSLVVLSPTRGEYWESGQTREIRWKSSGPTGPTVRIALLRDRRLVANIAAAARNKGSYRWTVPPLPPGVYTVAVAAWTHPVADFSDRFEIRASQVASARPVRKSSQGSGRRQLAMEGAGGQARHEAAADRIREMEGAGEEGRLGRGDLEDLGRADGDAFLDGPGKDPSGRSGKGAPGRSDSGRFPSTGGSTGPSLTRPGAADLQRALKPDPTAGGSAGDSRLMAEDQSSGSDKTDGGGAKEDDGKDAASGSGSSEGGSGSGNGSSEDKEDVTYTVTSSDKDVESSDGSATQSSTVTATGSDGSRFTHTVSQTRDKQNHVTQKQNVTYSDSTGFSQSYSSCKGYACTPTDDDASCRSAGCAEMLTFIDFLRTNEPEYRDWYDTMVDPGGPGSRRRRADRFAKPSAAMAKELARKRLNPYIYPTDDSGGEGGPENPGPSEPTIDRTQPSPIDPEIGDDPPSPLGGTGGNRPSSGSTGREGSAPRPRRGR